MNDCWTLLHICHVLHADCAFIDGNERREMFFIAVRSDMNIKIDPHSNYRHYKLSEDSGRCPLLLRGDSATIAHSLGGVQDIVFSHPPSSIL